IDTFVLGSGSLASTMAAGRYPADGGATALREPAAIMSSPIAGGKGRVAVPSTPPLTTDHPRLASYTPHQRVFNL
ncbi:MAG: hypothetical protein LC775_13860, partial [Acidobacteria bacterium]|nr:hypothetical protein [Acidobacteriota bacterium]